MNLWKLRSPAFLASAALMLGFFADGHIRAVGKGGGVRSAGNHPAGGPAPQHSGPAMSRPAPTPGKSPVMAKAPAVAPKKAAGFQKPTPPAGAILPKAGAEQHNPKLPGKPARPGSGSSSPPLNDFLGGGGKPAVVRPAGPATPKLPAPKEVFPGKKDEPEAKFPNVKEKLPGKKDQPDDKFPNVKEKLPGKKDEPEAKLPNLKEKLPGKKEEPEAKLPNLKEKLPGKKDEPEAKFPNAKDKLPEVKGKLPKQGNDRPDITVNNVIDYRNNQQAWIDNRRTTANQVRANAGNRYANSYNGDNYRRGYVGGYQYHSGWNRRGPFYGWSPVSYAALGTFVGATLLNTNTPVYYAYGDGGNVYYEDNTVYVNGKSSGTAEEYARQILAAVSAAPANVTETEWLPLGAFAFTREGVDDSQAMIELAVAKNGVVGGTYYNEATGVSRPLKGTIDGKTQRLVVGFADGKNENAALETGVYNLTQDEAPALLHLGNSETTPVLLVRLKAPEQPAGK